MPFTPELSRKLHQTLGAEAAADLMSWMHDMDAQRSEHREALRADIAEVRQEIHAKFTQVREEMHAGFARTDAQLPCSTKRCAWGSATSRPVSNAASVI